MLEARSLPSQRIDVRRLHVRVAMHAEVTPTLVVGEEDQDVGPFRAPCQRDQGWHGKGSNEERGGQNDSLETHRCASLIRIRPRLWEIGNRLASARFSAGWPAGQGRRSAV